MVLDVFLKFLMSNILPIAKSDSITFSFRTLITLIVMGINRQIHFLGLKKPLFYWFV